MDFLHLADAIDLKLLASALRPLVGADFEFQRDQFVECMVASWDSREVIIAHPLEVALPEYGCGGQLTENNAAVYITLAVKRAAEESGDVGHWQRDYASSIATILAATFGTEVLHSKSWEIDLAKTTFRNRRYRKDSAAIQPEQSVVFASGWKRTALVTTIESLRPKYDGPLDFMHVIHPRAIVDKRRPFPLMRGLTADIVATIQPMCTVLGPIEVPIGGRMLRGELVSIPYAPQEMFEGLSEPWRDRSRKGSDGQRHLRKRLTCGERSIECRPAHFAAARRCLVISPPRRSVAEKLRRFSLRHSRLT